MALTEKKNGNVVNIRGTLAENNLEKATFGPNNTNCIRGEIVIKVHQDDNDMFVPVRVFCSEKTSKGELNKLYPNWKEVCDGYKSIAAFGDKADRVECRGARLAMNEYYKGEKLVSFPTITSNFITRNPKAATDEATWSATMVVGKCGFKTDEDGVENPDIYEITAVIPRFNGSVDMVPMKATKKTVIDVLKQYWSANDTVNAMGKLNFTQETRVAKSNNDFGESQDREYTVNISDVIITGGNATPLEGEFAYDLGDIKEGIAIYKKGLADMKQRQADKAMASKATSDIDLGF